MSENQAQDPGQGGRYRERQITAIERRAITQRWPVPEGKRKAIIDKLVGIVESTEIQPREQVAAAKAILTADQINQEQEKRDGGIPDRLELTGPNGEAIQLEHGSAGPVGESARIAAAVAVLERARARALLNAPAAETADEVCPTLAECATDQVP